MPRLDNRNNNELRKIEITRHYTKFAPGSVLICFGETKVICTAIYEEKVPPFLKGSGQGWISAEYAMLPSSVTVRKQRDINKGRLDGRSAEIQRLIGRALRSVVNLKMLGERTIWLDCDVLQADGGTRTAAITGAYIALRDCIDHMTKMKLLKTSPLQCAVAAISCGILNDEVLLDLCYSEDSEAQADMNIVMTDTGEFIEMQGTGEKRPVRYDELMDMLDMAKLGIEQIFYHQYNALEKE
jgi:ribonuclease PH